MRCNMEVQAFGKGNVPPGTAFIPTPVKQLVLVLSIVNIISLTFSCTGLEWHHLIHVRSSQQPIPLARALLISV